MQAAVVCPTLRRQHDGAQRHHVFCHASSISLASISPATASVPARSDSRPLEHQLAINDQLPPQGRDRIQLGDHALDLRDVLGFQRGRPPIRIGPLTMLASPHDIAHRCETLRLRHFSGTARIVRAQRALAFLLLALLSRPLARRHALVERCDERSTASCGGAVDPTPRPGAPEHNLH